MKPATTLARQAAIAKVAAENWWPLYNHLARTAEAKAYDNFDLDSGLAAAATTLSRLAAIAQATSDRRVEDWLAALEAKALGRAA